jgi:hypothetical protein
MNRLRTSVAIALTAAAISTSSATALIPHEGGQSPDPDAALSARSSGLNEKYGLGSASGNAAPTYGSRPIVRMDGTPPVTGVGDGTSPPDRVDAASNATSVQSPPVVSAPPDRLDLTPASAQAQPRPIVAESGEGDFDWTAAGVGFAAALGIALLGTGSLVTFRWRRNLHTIAH